MQVAMTHAACIHADLDFTALGWQHFDLFETEWSPCFIEHCCLRLHSALLLYVLWYQENLPHDCRCSRIYEHAPPSLTESFVVFSSTPLAHNEEDFIRRASRPSSSCARRA